MAASSHSSEAREPAAGRFYSRRAAEDTFIPSSSSLTTSLFDAGRMMVVVTPPRQRSEAERHDHPTQISRAARVAAPGGGRDASARQWFRHRGGQRIGADTQCTTGAER